MATSTQNPLLQDTQTVDPAQSLLNDQTTGNQLQGVPPSTSLNATTPATTGLVSGSMASTPTPGTPNPAISSYSPSLGTVSDKETVSGQVNDLLNADNPIMQTARSQAAQAANSRGLLNSSMAVQSGEQAAINSALPIATQDASTYHDTAVRNQTAENEAGQFNTGAQNQSALLSQSGAQETALQNLRGTQATNLANIEANYKTLMQTSASASSLYSDIVKTIGALLDDPNTTADQKQQGVDKQLQLLQNGLSAIGATGNVDLAGLLDFSSVNSPIVPAPAATGTPAASGPAPTGTPGAGHNVGDTVTDAQGNSYIVGADGNLTQYGFA